jgi:hypothetical protein
MSFNILRYLLLAPNFELTTFLVLIMAKRMYATDSGLPTFQTSSKNINLQNRHRAFLLLVQAGCIDIIGIISSLSGLPVLLVIILMAAQGTYLIIDAERTRSIIIKIDIKFWIKQNN